MSTIIEEFDAEITKSICVPILSYELFMSFFEFVSSESKELLLNKSISELSDNGCYY